jgi:sugar phosphate isomerase/epimerase
MAGTLHDIGRIGYGEVEFAGYHGHAPGDIRQWLARAGVSAPSAHVAIEILRTDLDAAISAARVIGHRYLVLPWVPAPTTLAAWRELARECNRFGEACRDAGIQFAYHNHDFEFAPTEGRIPYDILLEECDSELVKMELDVYWAVKAGRDPVELFERHPGRFPLVHVKDMDREQGMTEVGSGKIDFARIFAHAGRAGLTHYIVEHDDPADPMASVRASFNNLQSLLMTGANQWTTLFDGTSLDAWRGYGRDKVPGAWRTEDGLLAFSPVADLRERGHLISRAQFGDFELEYEWRISPGGNSGVMWRVSEDAESPWLTGPEQQVLDDDRHADGKVTSHRAGALYDLVDAPAGIARPLGEFNRARVVVRGTRHRLWLNDHLTADIDFASEAGKSAVARSKFASFPKFARNPHGHIVLQDHGDAVWYRNIRVRELVAV